MPCAARGPARETAGRPAPLPGNGGYTRPRRTGTLRHARAIPEAAHALVHVDVVVQVDPHEHVRVHVLVRNVHFSISAASLQYFSNASISPSRLPCGEKIASSALLNGTGVSSAPRRDTGASSHSNASLPMTAATSPPNPPVVGAS